MDSDLTGQQLGPYLLHHVLGRGGMATVYLATHVTRRQNVALKVLDSALSRESELVLRFNREAQILSRLQHRFIVRVLDTGRHGTHLYVAMEHLIGESLDRLLKRVPHLSPAQVVSIGWQVADALAYAHVQHCLVHRDIKPGNLFLMQDGTIRILDFGVAAIMVDFKLATTRIGTPEYMPYEQASGQADYRSDIYGLGASLYHLGTGRLAPPFGIEAPTPPRVYNSEITPVLEQVLLKALQREPAARYQTAVEMRDALHQTWREYDPAKHGFTRPRVNTMPIKISGTPIPPPSRSTKPSPENAGWVVMLGVGLVIVLLFILMAGTVSSRVAPPPTLTPTPTLASMSGAPMIPASAANSRLPSIPAVPNVVTDTPTPAFSLPTMVTVTATPCTDTSPYGLSITDMRELGCPAQAWIANRAMVIQRFEHGVMLGFAPPNNDFNNPNGPKLIYALVDDGRAWRIVDTYTDVSSNPADWYACKVHSNKEPEVTGVPWRGFGAVWCARPEVQSALGAARSAELTGMTAAFQSYENGRAFQLSDWRSFPGWSRAGVYIVFLSTVASDFNAGRWEQR